MTFPIMVWNDVSIYYGIVGNIGAIVIMVITIGLCIFGDEDTIEITRENDFINITLVMLVGVAIALAFMAFWGLLVIGVIICIPVAFIYSVRMGYWKLKHWRFYRKYDR